MNKKKVHNLTWPAAKQINKNDWKFIELHVTKNEDYLEWSEQSEYDVSLLNCIHFPRGKTLPITQTLNFI